MNWIPLEALEQLDRLISASEEAPQIVFKHSTRCSISATALRRLEAAWDLGDHGLHFLDLIAHRDISNAIAERFGVAHQSPQLLVISKGKCLHHASHWDITVDDIRSHFNLTTS